MLSSCHRFMDLADIKVAQYKERVLDLAVAFALRLKWYWNRLTISDGLVLILIAEIAYLIWMQRQTRTRFSSRHFWRGWRENEKRHKRLVG